MKRTFMAVILTLMAGNASAQELQATFSDWSVFTMSEANKKTCYIASSPQKEQGNYKKRGEPYLLVTHRSRNVDEVSTSSGYPYKNNSDVALKIDDGRSYALFTTPEVPEIAWARDSETDGKLVRGMKRGSKLSVKGTSRLKSYSQDTYSLSGFTKAFEKMKSLCN